MPSDVFISYRRKDKERVLPLVQALAAESVSVWLDQSEINEFAPITAEIRKGLSECKALLAWYSSEYPKSRACQMEQTAAFIGGQREGEPRHRVLVVNPEGTSGHIEPIELRDAQYAAVPKDSAGYVALAGRIKAHIAKLPGPLGAHPARYSPEAVWIESYVCEPICGSAAGALARPLSIAGG